MFSLFPKKADVVYLYEFQRYSLGFTGGLWFLSPWILRDFFQFVIILDQNSDKIVLFSSLILSQNWKKKFTLNKDRLLTIYLWSMDVIASVHSRPLASVVPQSPESDYNLQSNSLFLFILPTTQLTWTL